MSRRVTPASEAKGAVPVGRRASLSAAAFSERVMAAIRQEATPTPTRTLMSALRARSVGDAGAALWVAWHLGTVRRWRVAPRVRARSIALVVAVALALPSGSFATAAAVRVAAQPVVQLLQAGIGEQGPDDNSSGPTEVDPRRQDMGDAIDGPSTVDGDGATDDDETDVATDEADDPDQSESDGGDESDTDGATDGAGGASDLDDGDNADGEGADGDESDDDTGDDASTGTREAGDDDSDGGESGSADPTGNGDTDEDDDDQPSP